ncbi:MAG: hypothetical protein QGH25_07015, partial [Candidatus Latescibacteria bacterium]|nr:hypothetical protein [Candidatus Latescibacterota bacterium]
SVNSSRIVEGSVRTVHIANGNVSESKLADNSVTSAKLADGAVSVNDIANDAVRTVHIANGNVSESKLANNSVTSAKLAGGAVGVNQLANDAVRTQHIANGSVTNGKIAANAVNAGKIADGSIGSSKVANNTVIRSLNGLKDHVNIQGGANIDISPSGSNLVISTENVVTTNGSGQATVSASTGNALTVGNSGGDGVDIDANNGAGTVFANFRSGASVKGNIVLNGAGDGVVYQSSGADYAEYLPRLDAGEQIEAGELVGVFGGKVSKRIEGAERVLAVSTAPFALGNMPADEDAHLFEKIGFIGQVPIKVEGPVAVGDYIVPSGREDGTAVAIAPDGMQPADFAQVVGRAWEASAARGVKRVNVAVGLQANDWTRFVGHFIREAAMLKARLRAVDSRLAQYEAMALKMARMEAVMARLEAMVATGTDEDVSSR